MADDLHPGVRRILDTHGPTLLTTLADELSAPDLTTLLLAVAQRRAAARTPSEILAQYQQDRFVGPATVPGTALRRVADIALRAAGFEEIAVSPLAPLGLHSVLGGISQNRVVSTMRSTEVAADPTNALALEAAVRRRETGEDVRLKAVQRVSRAQFVDGPVSFAHFTVLGLVTAGRDSGNHDFEINAVLSHISQHVALVRELGFAQCRVGVTDLSGQRHTLDRILEALARHDHVEAAEWPEREAGRDYYPSLCFKLWVTDPGGDEIEVADGGLTDWTKLLLQNQKERLMISGAGLDRLTLTNPG